MKVSEGNTDITLQVIEGHTLCACDNRLDLDVLLVDPPLCFSDEYKTAFLRAAVTLLICQNANSLAQQANI